MTLFQLLIVLRARWRVVARTLGIMLAVALLASVLLPKTYRATAVLVLQYNGIDPVTGIAFPGQMMPTFVQTQVGVIKSKGAALHVVQTLELEKNASFRKNFMNATGGAGDIHAWIAERLLKNLDVEPARDSNVVEISYKGKTATSAADVANAFARAYQDISMQLKLDPMKNAASYFDEKIKILRANVESAQQKLAIYQQEKGFSSAEDRSDVESARLNELATQLVMVQSQLADANSRRLQGEQRNISELPEVLASPLIQNLKASLAQAEAVLARVNELYTPDHPQYKLAKAEVEKLRLQLAAQSKAAVAGSANNARAIEQRQKELSAMLAAQKEKVVKLNRDRAQLALLARDVASAQSAYDAALQRRTQTNFEGQFNQSDAAVLNLASPPFKPASPRLLLNLALAVLGGLLLGVGAALIAEMRDRRIREPVDVANAINAPVIGVLDWGPETRSPAGLPRWNRQRVLQQGRV